MITVDMVRDGLRSDKIKFYKCDQALETVCKIGDYWFYMTKGKGQVDTVYRSLENLREWFPDEYNYYEAILKED